MHVTLRAGSTIFAIAALVHGGLIGTTMAVHLDHHDHDLTERPKAATEEHFKCGHSG